MGLFDLLGKKKKPDDLEHLTKDGELPWGWFNANREFTDRMKEEYSYFLNQWIESRGKEPKKQYEALKSFVLWMDDAKKLCSKNECFAKWFSDCIASDDYIGKRREEVLNLVKNFDAIDREWKTRQKELSNIDDKIEKLLKENDGILQSEFVKLFDQTVQDTVKEKLYCMDQNGKLQRTKQGRSYILHMK